MLVGLVVILAVVAIAVAAGGSSRAGGDGLLALRRLYIFLVTGASLGFLIAGLAGAGATVIELLAGGGALVLTYRQSVALYGAEIIVALPLWATHWYFAQRLASRQPLERGAGLRRLYLYGLLATLLVAFGILFDHLLSVLVGLLLGVRYAGGESSTIDVARTLWALLVVAVFSIYTDRVTSIDRGAVGETGVSATFRRWYLYGSQCVALLIGLAGAQALLAETLVNLFFRATFIGADNAVAAEVAQTVTGFGLWALQRGRASRPAWQYEDRRSTLRAVAGFTVVAIAVVVTLVNAGMLLHWLLARALGVAAPSGFGSGAVALAGPIAAVSVFGIEWALARRELRLDASASPAARQTGVGRLYRHLVAAAGLATFATGAGLLLWALVDSLVNGGSLIPTDDFRDRISVSVTLIAVGLPVWLVVWRPVVAPAERLALSRRLYLFAGLLAGVLLALGGGVWLASLLLRMVFGVATPSPAADIGHAFALLVVALAVGGYHGRVVLQDMSIRGAETQPALQAVVTEQAGAFTGAIAVEISGATEEQVRQVLAALPGGTSYELRSSLPPQVGQSPSTE